MGLFKRTPRIFVQIASYRDPECQWTVRDLFAKASHPDRIRVGICGQYDPEADDACFTEPFPYPKQVKEINVGAIDSQGVCWARHQAQSLYNGEDYILMIDSHMRFISGWDDAMIEEWRACGDGRAILTSYPPSYTPPDTLDPNPRLNVQRLQPTNAEGDIRGDGISLSFTPKRPMRGAFIACGFLFAPGRLVKEVPYDPHLYFNQEEISLAARFFTHGWNVYHPAHILLYHYYKKKGDPAPTRLHWEDHKDWHTLQQKARKRFYHLVGHKLCKDKKALMELEKYGLGTARPLSEFEDFAGVDFATLTVSEKARQASFIEELAAHRQAQTTGTDSLSPLEPGQHMPPFTLNDSTGKLREIQLYAGKRTTIFLLPADFPDYLKEFCEALERREAALMQPGWHYIFIVQGDSDKAAAIKQQSGSDALFLADVDGAVAASLGWHKNIALTPLTVLLNANQKILGMISERNAANHLGDVINAMQAQPAATNPYLITRMHAPVILVPDAINQSLAEEIITYWENGKQYKGTIGDGKDAKVVNSGKRRTDVNMIHREILAKVDDALSKTVLPEIRKVAALEVKYRDRYKIGCYESSDSGFYNQHRDTGIQSLAHRRYSMSLALADGYEGGYLTFPEYGEVHYKLAARSAILFPSTLLHAITPVTEGRRFIMVSFFHGDAEEAYRKEQMIARGETYNENDVRMLSAEGFSGMHTSEFFYSCSKTGGDA